MGMDAVSRKLSPGDAAVRAIQAGNDIVLHSPDDAAAVAAIKAAVRAATIPLAQIDASVRRILRAKARLGLHKSRIVSLDDVPQPRRRPGSTRLVAQALSQKSITLIKDDRNQVPLRAPREASVLYLSVLDYPSGWRIAAPSRTFIPELRKRWPNVTAIELSDRSDAGRDRSRARVGARATTRSSSRRLRARRRRRAAGWIWRAPLVKLLGDLARATANTPKPLVTVFFGNPYVALAAPDAAGDAADLRLLRSRRSCPPCARWPAKRRSRAGCRSRLPGLFECVGFGLVTVSARSRARCLL